MSEQRKPMSSAERVVRIELVRARAALERKRLLRSSRRLMESANPSDLVKSVLPWRLRSLASINPRALACQAVGFAKRYPMVLAALSTLVPLLGRKRKLLRLGATGVLLGVRMASKFSRGKR